MMDVALEAARGIEHFEELNLERLTGVVVTAQWITGPNGKSATMFTLDTDPTRLIWNVHARPETSQVAPYFMRGTYTIQPEALEGCWVDVLVWKKDGLTQLEAVMELEG